MKRRAFLLTPLALAAPSAPKPLLDHEAFRHYVDQFNRDDKEDLTGLIHNADAWTWMKSNIPFFTCPDADIELTYYYRWWAYRKHIENTPAGFVLTEFLKPVKHATAYNAISCAAGLHINEGRWLRDPRYLDDYVKFWLRGGDNGGLQEHFHQFSGWISAAVYDRWLADGRTPQMLGLLDALQTDYHAWEKEKQVESGLFWQRDVSDGMESSISGGRRVRNIRPTINSYMFANAKAIAAIAGLAGNAKVRDEYEAKAATLRSLVEEKLWNPQAQFFETVLENGQFANVRELIGYTPWYCNLPESGKGYEVAWKQLMDPKGFLAPYGPTTAEQRHPEFQIPYGGDDCQWNGPSWPFATSITLRALANVLNDYPQSDVSRQVYLATLMTYTRSQRLKLPDGRVIPWVDEDQDPITGAWLARTLKMRKPGFYGRGDHYNHSSYADLIITGLAGLRPRADETIEANPLLPPGTWDWFCLDGVPYHGRTVSIIWDRTGQRYKKGKGLTVLVDGRIAGQKSELGKLTASMAFGQAAAIPVAKPIATLVTSDIPHFWEAFDAEGADRAAVFQKLYFDRASDGLKDFIRVRLRSADNLAKAVEANKGFYATIRRNTGRVEEQRGEILRHLTRFRELYGDATFPTVYFMIGMIRTGGTTGPSGLLIGTEMYSLGDGVNTSSIPPAVRKVLGNIERLPIIVVHELVHAQQHYRGKSGLLAQSMTEGAADFVSELVTGTNINAYQKEWAESRRDQLFHQFAGDLAANPGKYNQWMYNYGSVQGDEPADLGYWIGAEICRGYYARATDKRSALKEIMTMSQPETITRESGYAWILGPVK